MNGKNPLVTIYCTAYNHRDYIEEAFRGFLMQKTSFPFEVFVFDDASNDGTSEIVRRYCERYPDIFWSIIMEKNIFHDPHRSDFFEDICKNKMRGKYLALCEADDYWIDKNKLQMQIDFMEQQPDVAMTVHASLMQNTLTGEKNEYHPFDKDKDLCVDEILNPPIGLPSTASMVVKRECFIDQLSNENLVYFRQGGDISNMLYALTEGRLYYFNHIMSVYRKNVPNGHSDRVELDCRYCVSQYYKAMHLFGEYHLYTKGRYKEAIRKRLNGVALYNALLCERIDTSEFDSLVASLPVEDKMDGNYQTGLKKAFCMFHDKEGFTEDEKKIINNCKYRVVFGTGDYSNCAKNMVEKLGFPIDGYLVGRGKAGVWNDKNVWNVNKYPFDKNETVVIAGVGPYLKDEIVDLLQATGYINYVGPMWQDFVPLTEH